MTPTGVIGTNGFRIRDAVPQDIPEIEMMVADFVRGHPAETHHRPVEVLRQAYFGEHPVAHLLVAERGDEIVGMVQWRLIHDMFWGMFGAEAGWLYVRPSNRGSGIVAGLVARLCAQAARAGACFVQGGGGEGPSKLYERVAVGFAARDCHLSGKGFQCFARLDGLPLRDIIRGLPTQEMSRQPADD